MSERQSPENLYQDLYQELVESREELQRLSSENRRLRELHAEPGRLGGDRVEGLSDSQERRIEESQAIALAAETARHMAEEKNLELSHLLTESNHQADRLQSHVKRLEVELGRIGAEAAAAQAPHSDYDATRAAVLRLQQQLTQLHATSKSKLEKMAEVVRVRHQLWEESQQHVAQLQTKLETVQRALEDSQQHIAQLQTKLETVQRALEEERSFRQRQEDVAGLAQLEELFTARGALDEERLTRQQRERDTQNELETTRQRSAQLEEELRTAQRALEEERVTPQQREYVAGLESTLEKVQAELAARSARIEELEEQLKKLQKESQLLRGELEDYQLALETSEEQIHFLDGEIADREDIVDSLHSQVAAYLDKLRLAQGKLYTVGEAVEQRNSWLRRIQDQNRALSAKCRTWEQLHQQAVHAKAQLEVEQQRTQQRNVQLEAECKKVQQSLAQANSDREQALKEAENLRWELEETVVSLDDSQNMVSSLQEQLARQIPEARHQLELLQARYDAFQHLGDVDDS